MKKLFYIFSLFAITQVHAQIDYNSTTNWYFHPDKFFNVINDYNLDIAVINEDLTLDSIIEIPNQSATNTGIDVFFVHPTLLEEIPSYPTNVVLEDQNSFVISSTILVQGGLLAKYGRFFAPRYRQASPSSFLSNSFSAEEKADALIVAYSDVKAAFLNYLENNNNGNKIILAGHSQGSQLLGFLLRDVFDNDPTLQSKLLTAALGGIGWVYSQPGEDYGGWWENIGLCREINECACIHIWKSYKEGQSIPQTLEGSPLFNEVMVDSGLIYRNLDLESDWVVQDSLYYGASSSPLINYITTDAHYNYVEDINFIAFNGLYTARFRREENYLVGLSVDFIENPDDQRPNELLLEESNPNFPFWGFHTKDYHIYLWALMQQIDQKIAGCQVSSIQDVKGKENLKIEIVPNPNNGSFHLKQNNNLRNGDSIIIRDSLGRIIKKLKFVEGQEFHISEKGVYFLSSKYGSQKFIVH